jgi:hypothetical protein
LLSGHIKSLALEPRLRLQLPARDIKLRKLTEKQQAMAMAFIYPEAEKGRGKKDEGKKAAETASFIYRRLAVARQILRFSRELADKDYVKRSLVNPPPATIHPIACLTKY